jgi:polyribonucleotide nucleotidyltransferase
MSTFQKTIDIDGKQIIIESGRFAPQSAGCVTVRCGDTIVMASVVRGEPREGLDYFPLQVEYREKHYAGGVISSSRFVKREGRPSDNEILTSRLIDRSIRPLFPDGYIDEVQVQVSPLSIDGVEEPEILGIIGASAALAISSVPWAGPVGAVRIGQDAQGQLVVNPNNQIKSQSPLDIVVSGSADSIAMVEAGASEVDEALILSSLKKGQELNGQIAQAISELVSEMGKTKLSFALPPLPENLVEALSAHVDPAAMVASSITLQGEGLNFKPLILKIQETYPELPYNLLAKHIDLKVKEYIRQLVLSENKRFDGRQVDQVRTIESETGVLPRTHGTGFFKRGETHVLSIVTLGPPDDEQLIDGMKGEETKRYMHHYNMPGYATGGPSRVGFPGRREIGHGALAERALIPVIPSTEEFPYTIRVVSEVMSSNGSTSQASVCGSSLALMDAGVPIKKPVAGIAMGLVTDGQKHVTLSDIAGLEDHCGDMDFKVAGTTDGVTAIQMDVKVPGVSADILGQALEQAKQARLHILERMSTTISTPRSEISQYAPKIVTHKVAEDRIGEIIGPGGKMIRQLQKDFEVEINIDDTGLVSITGHDATRVKEAKEYIVSMTTEPEVGLKYQGKVMRVENYGAFVAIAPGKEGLLHVSRIDPIVFQGLKVDQTIEVTLYEIDEVGRLNLTALPEGQAPIPRQQSPQSDRPSFGRDRGDRGPRSGQRPGGRDGGYRNFRDSR